MFKIDIKKDLLGVNGDMLLDISFQIKEKSFVALFGDSGSGKTTLLRILCGLEEAEGRIEVDGDLWLDGKKAKSPQKRGIGFVFQDYALFENMSVLENLLFVNNDKKLAYHLLDLTKLTTLKDRVPNSLSGGQKQRVALCRAMMNRPKLLLMDEPLSALDPSMRAKLQLEILSMHKEFGTTTIMVSHDIGEIYKMSDFVLVLEHGKIIKSGSAKEVFLQTSGSQKFSFEGELLDLFKVDAIYVAVVGVGQQLTQVVISESEAKELKDAKRVRVSTKAFAPVIQKISP